MSEIKKLKEIIKKLEEINKIYENMLDQYNSMLDQSHRRVDYWRSECIKQEKAEKGECFFYYFLMFVLLICAEIMILGALN